jgi:hypothetical protein
MERAGNFPLGDGLPPGFLNARRQPRSRATELQGGRKETRRNKLTMPSVRSNHLGHWSNHPRMHGFGCHPSAGLAWSCFRGQRPHRRLQQGLESPGSIRLQLEAMSRFSLGSLSGTDPPVLHIPGLESAFSVIRASLSPPQTEETQTHLEMGCSSASTTAVCVTQPMLHRQAHANPVRQWGKGTTQEV